VSAPLQAFVFSSYLLNVLLQLANKNGIQNKKKQKKERKAGNKCFEILVKSCIHEELRAD
jgi:hypothetical protein